MKHPTGNAALRRRDLTAGPALCLLLPAPSLEPDAGAKKLVETFHMMDLNQLYTCCFVWFLALGAIEYLVLRWVWRRWFSLER